MRIPIHRRRQRLEMNMTPMIDVVFLLIIFFLVSSHLARQEIHAELSLPAAESGEEVAEADVPRLTINIADHDGVPGVRLGALPVDRAGLEARLRSELARAGDALEVRIRSDRTVPYRTIEPVMLTCARLGIWNVRFAVVQREEGDR